MFSFSLSLSPSVAYKIQVVLEILCLKVEIKTYLSTWTACSYGKIVLVDIFTKIKLFNLFAVIIVNADSFIATCDKNVPLWPS